MNVLLCLLSDQHVPNLLAVHHFKPDRLVLIESAAMMIKHASDFFLRAIEAGGLDYHERYDIEQLAAEDDLEQIRACLRRAYGMHPTASWTANVTGGTKPMSIATYEFFKATAGQIVYTNVARPAELMHFESGLVETCEHKLTVKEFLAGYGFESRKSDDKLRAAKERALAWANCARALAKESSSQDVLKLSDSDRETARKKGWKIEPSQIIGSQAVASELQKTFQLNGNGEAGSLAGRVDKYAVEFLTGGWLEVFFWNLLTKHADALGVWDVRLGLEVGRLGDSSGNDCDVAFMREYGLSMVECKSGTQDHDPGGDILYKVEAVARQFRALRVRSFLATTATNLLNAEGQLKDSLQNRANIYNCRVITASSVQRLAKDYDSAEVARQVLFGSAEATS